MADADAPPSPPPSAMQPPSNASPPPPSSPPAYAPTSDATPAAAKTPNLPDTPASAYPDTPFSDADASAVASSDAAADAPDDAEDDGINASGARKHMTLAPPAPPSKKSKKKNNSNSVWTRPASRKGKKKAKQPAHAPSGANGSRHPKPKPSCGEDEFLPPAAAAGVTATVDFSPAATDLGGVHLLPCGIRHNSAAAVSDYFKSRDTGVEVDGVRVEEAFFRGRKLQGATLALPDGHRGYVLEKKSGGKDMQSLDGEVSNFVSRAEFQNITYWNHDTMPLAEDPLPRCFHWLTIANATAVVKGLQRCKGRDWFDYISALPLSELGLPFMSFDEVITVNNDDLILEAFKCMKDNKIGGVPVVEGPKRKLVGSVSIRDIRFLLLRPDLFSNFSEICYFKNGACQGTAFVDIPGGRYYPAASLYTLPDEPNCEVRFNFGPDFEFFPEDFGGRPAPKAMSEVPYQAYELKNEGPTENGIAEKAAQRHLQKQPKTLIVVEAYSIGKEDVYLAISQALEVGCTSGRVEHEASTSKIGEDQLFYFQQRGIDHEKAVAMMIGGFCKAVFDHLPLEFAQEVDALMNLKLEGSVG